jgi:hypothetical protein
MGLKAYGCRMAYAACAVLPGSAQVVFIGRTIAAAAAAGA